VLLAGGVAANRALRDALTAAVAEQLPETPVRFPPFVFCTDNAAMVAGAAHFALRRGEQAGWDADVAPRLALA
jgi:N6-L-threonylcarbamoyladenine synthase